MLPAERELCDTGVAVDWIDVVEYLQMLTAAFPEPLTFSLRARRLDLSDFDVVHDNQSLGFGLLSINRRQPFLATIHHPISRDRALDIAAAPLRKQITTRRWYAFVRMQAFVARRIRTGTMSVNGGVFYGADTPFGGYKSSGIGRQNGIEGFEQYTETKTISIGR